MYRRILVPLDGSELADQIIPYVKVLALGLAARVELVRAIEPVSADLTGSTPGLYPHQISDNLRSHARDHLDAVAAPLRAEGIEVSCAVHEGSPAPSILSASTEEPDTLIAMSTHGRTGITRWTLGSVTDKVVQGATVPLLINRCQESQPDIGPVQLKTVIVPLDGSPLAESILTYLVPLVTALNLSVTLLRVTPAADDYYRLMEYPVGDYGDLSRDVDALALTYLQQIHQRLKAQGISTIEESLVHDHPARGIIEFAQKTPDNLVVMGTHGRSGLGRWLLGSVADQVVCHSGDPVLLIRSTG